MFSSQDLSSDKDADAPSLKYVAAIEEYYQVCMVCDYTSLTLSSS